MNIDFASLKATVSSAHADAPLKLTKDGVQVASKPWHGFQVTWSKTEKARQNQELRGAVQVCLARTYALEHGVDHRTVQAAMSKVDWAGTTPLSARQVSQVIQDLENVRRAGPYVDLNLQGGQTNVLGSGAVNTVHLGTWKVDPATSEKMVFKAEAAPGEPLQLEGVNIGIPSQNPNLSGRNVATYQLSRALGLDVIPKTHYAVHAHQAGTVMALAPGASVQGAKTTVKVASGLSPDTLNRRLNDIKDHLGRQGLDVVSTSDDGTLELRRTPVSPEKREELIDLYGLRDETGVPLSDDAIRELVRTEGAMSEANMFVQRFEALQQLSVALDVSDPAVRSGMNQLQWLDNLCGQADRHPGNIFIERSPDGRVIGVKGIDNDMSFGVNSLGDVANTGKPHGAGQAKYPAVPKVIDASLRDQLLAMANIPEGAPGSIEQLLGDTLAPGEVAAARARLMNIRDHLTTTGRDAVRVIDSPQGWTASSVHSLLGFGVAKLPPSAHGACNSYLENCYANQSGQSQQPDNGVLQINISQLRAGLAVFAS